MTQIVILAAGKGTRMNSDLPKVLVPLNERPLIDYLLEAVIKAEPKLDPIIVVSPENKQIIQEALSGHSLKYAVQEQQLGTGHAVASARDLVPDEAKSILVLYGDHPFISSESIKRFIESKPEALSIAPTKLEDFNDWRQNFYHWGRIVRNDFGKITAIVEFKDASSKEREISEVNPGFMCFNKDWLFKNIDKLNSDNKAGEFYLTDMVKIAKEDGQEIGSLEISPKEVIGVNSQEELAIAKGLL